MMFREAVLGTIEKMELVKEALKDVGDKARAFLIFIKPCPLCEKYFIDYRSAINPYRMFIVCEERCASCPVLIETGKTCVCLKKYREVRENLKTGRTEHALEGLDELIGSLKELLEMEGKYV